MGEFSWIEKHFAPLSGAGSFNLKDDCAKIGNDTVISCDTVTQGVHFPHNISARLIAKRALRVALSDIAAMGAKPMGFLVALSIPPDTNEDWIADFASGLREDQKLYETHLIGGDTTKSMGGLSVTITVLGKIIDGNILYRNGAKEGDGIYISGEIGAASLGLKSLLNNESKQDIQSAFLLPTPFIGLGQKCAKYANAAIDISDGLIADIGHMASASNLKAILFEEDIPVHKDCGRKALTAGDDYVLAIAISQDKAKHLSDFNLHKIGVFKKGNIGVEVLDKDGRPIEFKNTGWKHFNDE